MVAFSFSVPAEWRGVELLRGVDRCGSDVLIYLFFFSLGIICTRVEGPVSFRACQVVGDGCSGVMKVGS